MRSVQPFAIGGGVLVVVLIVSDAIGTLIVTQSRTGVWRPTRLWYGGTWRLTRIVAARLPARLSDWALGIYPAIALLGLLVLWLAGLMIGWSLVYWGTGQQVASAGDFGSIVYYAGSLLLSPSFGSVHGQLLRMITLIETLTGLGTVALLISYLPALYGAYSKREARLLTLDDPQGRRISPEIVIATHVRAQNPARLFSFCEEWENWTAEILESHVSFPMLALFRSQHPGQSWITALGTVTDAAAMTCAVFPEIESDAPYMLYLRGRRTILAIASQLHVPSTGIDQMLLYRGAFGDAWKHLQSVGLPMRSEDESWDQMRLLRNPYGPRLQELINHLLAPHGFWGHSAEDHVAEEVAKASAEARKRARGFS